MQSKGDLSAEQSERITNLIKSFRGVLRLRLFSVYTIICEIPLQIKILTT